MNKIIILDPGHGGSDPGAVGNGLKEKDLNLAISLATRDELKNYNCTVKMVRTKDVYVSLSARAAMGKGADLFVSQHNNAFTSNARGFETFCHSGTLLPPTLGYRNVIHDTISPYLKGLGVPDRGKKRYNHYITREPACPTVLVEYLFVTNATDAVLLKKSAVLKELGRLTAVGIVKALGLKKKPAPGPKPPKLPVIIKAVGVRFEGKEAGIVGYYSNEEGTLYPRAVIEKMGATVSGHGDYVNIVRAKAADPAQVQQLQAEVAALKAENASLKSKIDTARKALS